MYSLDNITAANGWAMAAIGASIVFVGLVVLSFAIAQIHKILGLWEERNARRAKSKILVPAADAEQKAEKPAPKDHHMPELEALVSTYKPLVEQMDEPFELAGLFKIAKEKLNEDNIELLIQNSKQEFDMNNKEYNLYLDFKHILK